MFIFRPLAYLIAILGYVLAGVTVYLGLNPVEYPTQEPLDLKSVFNCTPTKESYTNSELTNQKIEDLRDSLGESLPIDLVKDLSNTLESVANSIGATTAVNIEYCNSQGNTAEAINLINQNLSTKKKYYEYGTIQQFVESFNQLPYAKLTNIQVNVASTFARSNICNKPVNKTNLYLFTAIDTNIANSTRVVLFNVQLQPKADSPTQEKLLSNLIISGHYLKARFTCNG